MLHDFGYRGATSTESSMLCGSAHLLSFSGTDTIPALTIPENASSDEPTTYSISLPSNATGYLEVDVDGTKYVATVEYQADAPSYKLGDVNSDNKKDAVDALWILQAAVDKRSFNDAQKKAADVNKDSKADAVDALWILQAAVDKRVLPET